MTEILKTFIRRLQLDEPFTKNISEIQSEIFKDRNVYDQKTKQLNNKALEIVSGEEYGSGFSIMSDFA